MLFLFIESKTNSFFFSVRKLPLWTLQPCFPKSIKVHIHLSLSELYEVLNDNVKLVTSVYKWDMSPFHSPSVCLRFLGSHPQKVSCHTNYPDKKKSSSLFSLN